ncbi:MAG: MFS transporter [Anaerolineae bacterium]|jgi:UMF1 family MFS transporter|nr:MFS transporter [Anaerolineae bacterium]MBT3714226.1 MFS transporter [Anaerolineae bacterium]MBT4309083.1 MFS transporter [Anaerolineae bacterium]MBT4457562.1 MFS transporter [Anaerolineae bacterium]MBT4840845.1 MFS transporter [Anaerolineae bacterium]
MSAKKTVNREHRAWYMYDFGNSAYAAVVLLAIYSAYFKDGVVGGAEGSRLWGVSVGVAMLVVAIISPILGTIADFTASKKRFLFLFSSLTWVFTALLFFVQKGDIFIGMLFFIIAEIGYRGAQVFYNSLLPEIASPDEIGRVSGNGWAIGNLGGILALLILLPPIVLLKGTNLPVRLSFPITAIFFALSTIPAYRWIKERANAQTLPAGKNHLTLGFKRLARTFRSARQFKEFIKFMIAFLVYNDGILMALDFAAIIGAVLYGVNQTQMIIFMIIVQVSSIGGAYGFATIGEKVGYKRSLIYALIGMIVTIVWMLFNQTITGFFIIGALAGLMLTGVQSISRTMVGMFAPKGQSAEFFGLFSVVGRTSSFIGPTIYGFLALWAARWFENNRKMGTLVAEQAGQRIAIASILVFLFTGLFLLLRVNEKKAIEDSKKYSLENGKGA